jgi:hypothetical protein
MGEPARYVWLQCGKDAAVIEMIALGQCVKLHRGS